MNETSGIRIAHIVLARCPRCGKGGVRDGLFGIRRRCASCDYDFYPEPGFYLGAMVVGYLAAAFLMIPVIIALKLSGMEIGLSFILWPIAIYALVAPVILHYARIIWLHLEHRMTGRLSGNESRDARPRTRP